MIQILNVKRVVSHLIESAGATYHRRNKSDWRVFDGDSWKTLYDSEEIEKEYQKFKNSKKRPVKI